MWPPVIQNPNTATIAIDTNTSAPSACENTDTTTAPMHATTRNIFNRRCVVRDAAIQASSYARSGPTRSVYYRVEINKSLDPLPARVDANTNKRLSGV